jgi:hypothetical protein
MKKLFLLASVIVAMFLVAVFFVVGCSKSDDKPKNDDELRGSQIVFCEHEPDDFVFGDETEEVDAPQDWEDWGDFPEEYVDDFIPPQLPSREELTQRFKDKLAEMQALVGASGSNDISNIISAQVVCFNDVINTDNWECVDGTKLNRFTLIQTMYYVYGVYSFDQNKDYYIMEQEITIPSSNLWSDKVREKKYNKHNYKSKDFYLSWLRTENRLTKNGNYLNDAIAVSQYSPETVNGQITYTAGISGNIGGTIGYMGGATATVDGGISYSISKTWTVQDINVKNYVLSDIAAKDASWEWTTMKVAKQNFWLTDIEDPADLATTTAKFSTTWLWIVDKPGKTDEYKINMKVRPKYTSFSLYVEWLVGHATYRNWTSTFNHNFILTPPNRVKQ